MTDYTDLINELTCYAKNDQDFIDPHESINTKAAEAIRQLVIERDKFAARRCEVCGYMEHHREHTGCLRKEVEKLTAERDAAFAMSKCECESNEACANLVNLHEREENLINALMESTKLSDNLYSKGHRLALELECLLSDTKDTAIVSKWWDSAHEALEDWRK